MNLERSEFKWGCVLENSIFEPSLGFEQSCIGPPVVLHSSHGVRLIPPRCETQDQCSYKQSQLSVLRDLSGHEEMAHERVVAVVSRPAITKFKTTSLKLLSVMLLSGSWLSSMNLDNMSGSINLRVTVTFAESNALANSLCGKFGANVPISTPNPTLHMESSLYYLHIYCLIIVGCLTEDFGKLKAILSENNCAKVPQILGCKLEASRFPLFSPKLPIDIENAVSKQHLHI
ncbi:response regulator [Striga asiatica]|uniref:Response regulator n=1 Tax=Striga asiatica TaxID=4170 RepID=A0A5A7PJU6_STRAF|nr:response regulator [Striga asiatica]